jgi:PadR family transcriptional regulator PadR
LIVQIKIQKFSDDPLTNCVSHSIIVIHGIKKGGVIVEIDIATFETEMNRGFLQILVLLCLDQSMYGYKMINVISKIGYKVEENTLYPLLRRLESKGIISGKWEVSENRPKKFYKITPEGKRLRKKLLKIWKNQNNIIAKFNGGK